MLAETSSLNLVAFNFSTVYLLKALVPPSQHGILLHALVLPPRRLVYSLCPLLITHSAGQNPSHSTFATSEQATKVGAAERNHVPTAWLGAKHPEWLRPLAS